MEQLFLTIVLLSAALASPILKDVSQASLSYRLPGNVEPVHYKIKLTPLLPNVDDPQNFEGEVEITVRMLQDTDYIVLHYNDMVIKKCTVTDLQESADVSVADFSNSAAHFYYIVKVEGNFVTGRDYLIKIEYTGYHRDDMYGFYRSYYIAEDGSKKWLATTQFQPTHARRAFPCFDEPAIKSTFEISIKRQGDRRAISNMPLRTDVVEDGWDHFQTTPKMSAYLTAFIVSDFANYNDTDNVYNIWARQGAIQQAQYSYSIAAPTIQAMEDFLLGYKYPLPKMDEVAVPDFSAGAMENWGLCTYRERLILYDASTANAETKQRIATVVAHEFAHQWFGDLVSPEWWNYLWLNEGFATYFESFATDMVETLWRMKEQFVVRDVHSSLAFDALESTHPMTQDVDSPNSIRSIFDSISYEKAGSVIRMMEHFVTTDVFKKGLNKYLGNRDKNFANEDHLYEAMEEEFQASNPVLYENVKEVMYSWTRQAGHPVVTVTAGENNQLTLKQERFYFTKTPTRRANTLWKIPITYTVQDGSFTDTTTKLWLKEATATINRPTTQDKWHIFNVQQTGFYRVNYDEANWKLLIDYLNSDSYNNIHPVNRAQLLNDALNLARAGILDYGTALDVTRYLHHETDYIPWYSALSALSYLKLRITGTEGEQHFKEYLLTLLEPIYRELDFNEATDDSHITKLHRGIILQWACDLDHDHCIETAKTKFSEAHSRGVKSVAIPADLQSVVYCTAVRHGGETEWNHLWNTYLDSNFASEQTLVLTALGCTTDQNLINGYLEKSITADAFIRRQDAASVFSSVYANPAGVDLALNFLENRISSILQFYGTGVSSIISGIASRVSTEEQFNKLDTLIQNTDLGAANDAARRAVETARENLQWYTYYGTAITSWLQNELDPTTTTPSSTTDSSATLTLSSFAFTLFVFHNIYIFIRYWA